MMSIKERTFLKFRELVNTLGMRHFSNCYTRPMTVFTSRYFNNGKKLVAVEIGCSSGYNAKNICENLNIKKIYCIDPYSEYFDRVVRNDFNYYSKAKKLLSKYPVTFIQKYSIDAVNDIPDNLDFCYIDGNHQYEFVKKDIELYYPKVRKDGIIGGHDFEGTCMGVVRAVLEFANNNNLELFTDGMDWWMVKK